MVARSVVGSLATSAVVASGGAFALAVPEAIAAQGANERVSLLTQSALGEPQDNWDARAHGRYVPRIPEQLFAVARNAFGDRYAGLDYWRGEGRAPVLVLRLVRPTEADRLRVVEALRRSELSFITSDVAIVPAPLGERSMRNIRTGLQSNLGDRAESVTSDPITGKITVLLRGAAGTTVRKHALTRSESALLRRLRVNPRHVHWVVAPPAKEAVAQTGTYGSAAISVFVNGRKVTETCTSGFAFRAPTGVHMATAGHCSTEAGGHTLVTDKFGGGALGPIVTRDNSWDRGDMAAYAISNAAARQWISNDMTYYVQGSAAPQAGEWVCFKGSTSGRRCGKVLHTEQEVYGKGHQFCIGENGALGYGAEGDSGSAMWVEDGDANVTKKVSIRGVATQIAGDFRYGHLGEPITCGTTVNWMMNAWGGSVMTEGVVTGCAGGA